MERHRVWKTSDRGVQVRGGEKGIETRRGGGGARGRNEIKGQERKNRDREGESRTSGESDLARLPPNRGYLRLISKESCQVSANSVLTETGQ